MGIVLSQPESPPKCDISPRRLPTVDTESEEPETPRRSPAIGTGSDEPGVSRAESTKREEMFPVQASVNGFLRFNCTRPEQECILLQPDVGVDDEKDQPTTSQQAAAREEFARPTKKRQQQRMTAWSTGQNKQFDRGRSTVKPSLFCREESLVAYTVCFFFVVVCFILLYFFCLLQKAATRGEDNFHSRMREQLGCKPDA